MSRIIRSIYYSFHYIFHLQFLPSIFFEFSPFLHILNFLLPHSLDFIFSKKFNSSDSSTFFWFSIQFLLSPYFIIRPPTFFKSFPSYSFIPSTFFKFLQLTFFYSFLLHSFNSNSFYILLFIPSIHSFNSFLLHNFIHSLFFQFLPSTFF